MELRERLKALRKRLGLTQEAMAQKAGLGRVEVVRVEGGHNDATSYRLRAGLARAAGLSVEQLSAFLDGEIDLDELVARKVAGAPSDAEGRRRAAAELAREASVYEPAIEAVLAEAIKPEDLGRSRLWWADQMRYRAHEMLTGEAPIQKRAKSERSA